MDDSTCGRHIRQAIFFYMNPSRKSSFAASEDCIVMRCVRGSGNLKFGKDVHKLSMDSLIVASGPSQILCMAKDDNPMLICLCRIGPVTGIEIGGVSFSAEKDSLLEAYMPKSGELKNLMDYIFTRFSRQRKDDWRSKYTARIFLDGLDEFFSQSHLHSVRNSHYIRKAVDYVTENIDRPISTGDIALHLGCSISTVTRHFRKELGKTPVEWINNSRMERACRLLVGTNLTVGEVGQKVGVDDPYYFSRMFRRYTATTPSRYRND